MATRTAAFQPGMYAATPNGVCYNYNYNNNNNNNNNLSNGYDTAERNGKITNSPSTLPKRSSVWLRLLKFLVFRGPLLVCWGLLLTSILVKEVWRGPLEELLKSFKLDHDESDKNIGTYTARDHEQTYYHRRCDHRDISTHDANDLLIDPEMTSEERKAVVMTHGAVVMKEILPQDTATELREYLEIRHHEYHSNNLKLPWDELFWDGDNGSRLSLGLGPEDAPIIARAISEVGSNEQLKKTLEATLGKDPAVVEVSTLSTMHNAEPQGIHTDSDWFGSSVMYTRSFLHSYTMFIALQDTTSRMGATTICPGTHWCADEDLEGLCQCNFLDDDFDQEHPLGFCNTFEASSNGQTGLEVGVLQKGDAMMFNQNVWHRGPRNYDLNRKENRVMFILTFISRRDFDKGDNRQQGWGTYYYMRHSMWGHLFSDLKTAASGGMDLLKSRIWKAYGLMGSSKRGNLPWLEHWARQQSNDMDFFMHSELEDFRVMLRETTHPVVKWFFLDDAVLKYLFGGYSKEALQAEEKEDGDELGWKEYINLLVESSVYQSRQLYFVVVVGTVLVHVVGYLLYCASWYIFGRTGSGAPQPVRDASKTVGKFAIGHLCVLGMALVARHYVLHRAPLFRRIHDGSVHFDPIPRLPLYSFVEDEHDEETGEVIAEHTVYEELHPVDLLLVKQDRDQQEFRRNHPPHPYREYYDEELDRLEDIGYRRSTLQEELLLPPFQESAFPERLDVLIGSRFDARFLASMNSVLDFHPGNKEWIGFLEEYRPAVLARHRPNKHFLDIAAKAIVSRIFDGWKPTSAASALSTNGSVPRRFLKQDPHTGWWVTLRRGEAIRETKRALLARVYPESLGLANDHWKEVLAESRFGRYRHSVMAKTWTAQRVEHELTTVFRGFEDTPNRPTRVTPMDSTMPGVQPMLLPRPFLLPSTARSLLPKSVLTGKTALSPTPNSRIEAFVHHTMVPFREHARQLEKDVVTLKTGDHILCRGAANGGYFAATIVDIDAEEDEIEIRPLRNGDVREEKEEDEDEFDIKPVTRNVDLDEVQFYRSVRENDHVWALSEDPAEPQDDEEEESKTTTESWKVYEVLYISPFGQAELGLTQEFVTHDDDEEEFVQNKRIIRDVRDIFLAERHLPKMRLRQYY